jgi:hypothetical protein
MPTYYDDDDDEAKMEQGSTTFISSSYSDNLISNASASTSSQFLNDKPEREDRSKVLCFFLLFVNFLACCVLMGLCWCIAGGKQLPTRY